MQRQDYPGLRSLFPIEELTLLEVSAIQLRRLMLQNQPLKEWRADARLFMIYLCVMRYPSPTNSSSPDQPGQ